MFETTPPRKFKAITAIIDLEGFTTFCTHPDNHSNLPGFLNFVFERLGDSLSVAGLENVCTHMKFLGDGALLIWSTENCDTKALGKKITLALHNLFRTFPDDILEVADDLGVYSVPRRIRIGITQGEIIELRSNINNENEYVGFCINLAARLQHYCTPIGFLISSTVALPEDFIEDYSLVKAKTKNIRGIRSFEVDVRYVSQDAAHLSKREMQKWFSHSL